MSDDDNHEIESEAIVPIAPDAFSSALTLLAVAADPKKTQERLATLATATDRSIKAKAAAEEVIVARSNELDQRERALSKRAAELDRDENAFLEMRIEQDRIIAEFRSRTEAHRELDVNLRWRLAHHYNQLEGLHIEQLQMLPTWEQIDKISKDVTEDPRLPSMQSAEPVPEAQTGSTLTRAVPIRSSARRNRPYDGLPKSAN